MTKEEIVTKAEAIQGWMTHEELELIYDLAWENLDSGGLAVEIGSWKGRSAFVTANVCKEKGARLICIDTFSGCESQKALYEATVKMGPDYFMDQNIKMNLEGLPVTLWKGDSTAEHKKLSDEDVSFCFIDGDHFNPVVGQDIDNFWPKIKHGGIFSGHDYTKEFPDVITEVNRKFPNPDDRKIKHSIWIIKKE